MNLQPLFIKMGHRTRWLNVSIFSKFTEIKCTPLDPGQTTLILRIGYTLKSSALWEILDPVGKEPFASYEIFNLTKKLKPIFNHEMGSKLGNRHFLKKHQLLSRGKLKENTYLS